MRTVDLIQKKRDGGELSRAEIRHLIEGYSRGEIPDYQIAAWAMAVFFRAMTARETAALTLAMAESGDQVDLSAVRGIKVDKHSTGGVGDTTTLVLAPLVAAAGVPVAKMAGRGLGHTGGTIDKLESIPGFRVVIDNAAFLRQVNEIGVAVVGQSGNLTPADKKLYALRDVTATVNSIPLIASSVMSKKIAAGADAIVLDVKMGAGAFMKTADDALALARAMVAIGTEVGREVVAVVTSMAEPLGYAIGNALEVREAIETLGGGGPADLRELCLTLGAEMVTLGGVTRDAAAARTLLERLIADGSALGKFREFVVAQGGRGEVADDLSLLPAAERAREVLAPADGYVQAIEAESIGVAAMTLGAGRETKDDTIDPASGIVLRKKVGDAVAVGEPLAVMHTSEAYAGRLDEVRERILGAYTIRSERVSPAPLIYAIVTKDGTKLL